MRGPGSGDVIWLSIMNLNSSIRFKIDHEEQRGVREEIAMVW